MSFFNHSSTTDVYADIGLMERAVFLFLYFFTLLSSALSATVFITDPSSDTQPTYVIGQEGEDIPIFCTVVRNDAQVISDWEIKRTIDSNFQLTMFNSTTGELTSPSFFIGKFTAFGELAQSGRSFQTNFTIVNFTTEFDLAEILCGVSGINRKFIVGLRGNNISIQQYMIVSL